MATCPYRSWVEISRGKLINNLRAIRQAAGPGVEVAAVVKADAYRHGATEVSRTLLKEGVQWLAVSNTEEGAVLRDAGIDSRILVMADFLPISRIAQFDYRLTPVIHSLEDMRELDRLAAARDEAAPFHLKIDTGMGRLGTRAPAAEICEAILSLRAAKLEGLMTHFASAADYATSQTDDQIRTFESVRACLSAAGIRPRYVHLSSSTPIGYHRKEAMGNMVRPGHALYGYLSQAKGAAPRQDLPVEPVLVWKAAVLAIKEAPAGALIGYGGMYRASHPIRIAIIAAGYADGIPHRLSNRGKVIVNGKLAPILGAVSMDLTTIDITQSPELQPGDSVTILGREGDVAIDAQQIARLSGTISYAVLCGISSRVKRVYV